MLKKIAKKIIYSFPSSIVFMLHQVTEDMKEELKFSLTKSNLQLLISKCNNWATLDDIICKKEKYKVNLTFDDGYEDIYNIVYPICKINNVPFTIFITYELLNTPGYLTKDQLLELSRDMIVTIGSHNLKHLPLPTLSRDEQENQILRSRESLENLIGKPIKFLAYPFGQYDKNTLNVLKKTKLYSHAFTANGHCLNWYFMLNKYRLPRMNLSNLTINECINNIYKLTVKPQKKKPKS